MIRKALLALVFVGLAVNAQAQNTTCATRPAGDSSNACASTAFATGGIINLLAANNTWTGTQRFIPSATGFPQPIYAQTSLSGSGSAPTGSTPYLFYIPSDTYAAGAAFVNGLEVSHSFGGSAATGGRQGFASFLGLATATNAANSNRNYVAGQFTGFAIATDGGTNTGAGALGAIFGSSSWGDLQNTATNFLNVTGAEFDVSIRTGASAKYKTGIQVASHASDVVDAALVNAGIAIGAQVGSIKFSHGIVFTDMGTGGGSGPVKAATGTLIGASNPDGGTLTAAFGVDLSLYTFVTCSYKSTGFCVGPTGVITGIGTNITGTASLNINGTVGATTPTTGAFTTIAASTSITSPLHIGGSGTTGTQLTFQTTTGNGTTDAFVWKGGNNGATTFATLATGSLVFGAAVGTISLGATGTTAQINTVGAATDINVFISPKGAGGVAATNPSGGSIAAFNNAAGVTASTNSWAFGNAATGNAISIGPSASSVDAIVNQQWYARGTGNMQILDSDFSSRLTISAKNTASTSATTGTAVLTGGLGITGAVYGSAEITTGTTTVASLPTCNAAHKAARHFVTDANAAFTAGIGAVVAAGGANNVPVTCDGTNWRIGANDNFPLHLNRKFA